MTTFDITTLGTASSTELPSLMSATEPTIHGLVGAQFGDLEFDVGKSVRWTQFFCNDLFIVDINTGEQRYWVVNWTESFPEAQHVVTGRNFFREPAIWRKEQFAYGDKAFNYKDEDWCLFIDAHEGVSFDNRSLPDDYVAAPFLSWLYREVARAVADGDDVAYLPFFVYLNYSDLQNVSYYTQANDGGQQFGIPPVQQAISVPWYLPTGYLARLIKVSALRDLDFDWNSIDQPTDTAPPGDPKMQVLSYGYAHWNLQDIPAGQTEVPALNASNDDGYRMRNLISLARPIAGIPYGEWRHPSTDPATLPGPWCVDTTVSVDPTLEGTVEEKGHTPPDSLTAGIRVPLYDSVMRLNLRDGLWYERGISGNVPLSWDETNQVWAPNYDPAEWAEKGVGSVGIDPPPPSSMSLRLDGAVGSYAHTSDANYFDFADQEAFTLTAAIAPSSWHPTTRKCIVSKFTNPSQRSWCWGIESGGGMYLCISRTGTTVLEVSMNLTDGAAFDLPNQSFQAVAATYVTNLVGSPIKDEVRFWMNVGTTVDDWQQVGSTLLIDNPSSQNLFASTAGITVGATNVGNLDNFAGHIRLVSIRRGVGEKSGGTGTYVGGDEVGVMRGDSTVNPGYDRYGNLWVNEGGWTYEELP